MQQQQQQQQQQYQVDAAKATFSQANLNNAGSISQEELRQRTQGGVNQTSGNFQQQQQQQAQYIFFHYKKPLTKKFFHLFLFQDFLIKFQPIKFIMNYLVLMPSKMLF